MMTPKIYPFFMLVAITILTTGCGKKKMTYPAPAAPPNDGAFVFQADSLKVGSINYAADFATITVPENRNKPDSRLIDLPVIRIHALADHPAEPVFCLAGGPGASNMKWMPIDTLLTNHDFVMVGYRGVDGSSVLDCPEISAAFKGEDGDPLSQAALQRIGQAWNQVAERFRIQGIDINGYTMPQTIGDIEAVRQALNYERINLLSESYGTRVAYLYGLLHPERICRSVMIAVNPPGHFVWEPEKVDEQLNYYARLWANDPVMSKKTPDLAVTMRTVLRTMPKKWLCFSINPGKVKIATFGMLFHRTTAAIVFDAYVAAGHGDYSGLALLSLAYDYIVPSMSIWGDLAAKAVSADFDSTRNYASEPERPDAILGSPMNQAIWGPFSYSRFRMKMIAPELRTLRSSDVPTLLLSGSLDFSTPPESATNELLPYLLNGQQIILSEYGHVGDLRYLRQQTTNRLITDYFNSGDVDTSVIEYVPMDFHVSWGLPKIAKVLVGVVIVLGIGLIVGMGWIVKKIF